MLLGQLHTSSQPCGLHVVAMADKEPAPFPPEWWMKELLAAIGRLPRTDGRPGSGRATDLAYALVPKGLAGKALAKELNAAKVRINRFISGESRSEKVMESFRVTLGLPHVTFVADSAPAARAMAIAASDPDKVLAALVREDEIQRLIRDRTEQAAAARVMNSAQSGADRMLGDESEDGLSQPRTVEPVHANSDRGGRRRGGTGTGAAAPVKK